MRRFIVCVIVALLLAVSATPALAQKPPSEDHQRCTASLTAKSHAPEWVALGVLDVVAAKLGCPVG
jgi:hypothetical protein